MHIDNAKRLVMRCYRSLFTEAYLVKLIPRGLVTVANIFN